VPQIIKFEGPVLEFLKRWLKQSIVDFILVAVDRPSTRCCVQCGD